MRSARMILGNRSGKSVTIEDIAKDLGVSHGIVGYVPNYWARSFRKKRTGMISVLLPGPEMNWADHI